MILLLKNKLKEAPLRGLKGNPVKIGNGPAAVIPHLTKKVR
jgi:hypothetical protein